MSHRIRSPLLAARVAPELKLAFDALADREGVSSSALLTRVLRTVLDLNESLPRAVVLPSTGNERLSLRLRPGDREALEALARSRKLRAATYVTALVHSHLHSCPALPMQELAAMKVAASHLAATSRHLQHLQGVGGGTSDEELIRRLDSVSSTASEVRVYVGNLVRASLRCWESGHV